MKTAAYLGILSLGHIERRWRGGSRAHALIDAFWRGGWLVTVDGPQHCSNRSGTGYRSGERHRSAAIVVRRMLEKPIDTEFGDGCSCVGSRELGDAAVRLRFDKFAYPYPHDFVRYRRLRDLQHRLHSIFSSIEPVHVITFYTSNGYIYICKPGIIGIISYQLLRSPPCTHSPGTQCPQRRRRQCGHSAPPPRRKP